VAITFDGANKRIVLDSASVSAATIWSRWADWHGANPQWPLAFRQVGGDALGGGLFIPPYFFLQSGWRVRPMESNHNLTITGNLFVEGGGVPVVSTLGTFQVNVNYTVPVQAQGISTSGGTGPTAAEIAAEVWGYAPRTLTSGGGGTTAADVWSYATRTLTTATSSSFMTPLAFKVSTTTTAADPGPGRIRWNSTTQSAATELYLDTITDDGTDIDNYIDLIPVGSMLYVQDKDDAANVQKWLITGITHNVGWSTFAASSLSFSGGNLPNNHAVVVLFNNQIAGSLSTEQATQLAELYRVHGLQLGFPLTVTETSRQSDGVNQSISNDGITTVVTRL
jgi:hypothetical protein